MPVDVTGLQPAYSHIRVVLLASLSEFSNALSGIIIEQPLQTVTDA